MCFVLVMDIYSRRRLGPNAEVAEKIDALHAKLAKLERSKIYRYI